MNYKLLFRILSYVLLIEAGFLIAPTVVAAINGEALFPFIITIALLVAVSVPFLIKKPKNKRMYAKEGFVAVGLCWILMSIFGALPFVFSGSIPNYIDALFEVVSGFTTTGATVLDKVEHLPYGILFWRSLTHWLGGMGVLVLMLALFPGENGSVIYLMRAEVPGPQKGKLVPKMRSTAIILYSIYIALTAVMVVCLMIAGLDPYHALVNAFSTAGTGGFSVLDNSIAGYGNPAVEWIVAIFMVIFSVNFNLYFFILIRKFKAVLKNEELRILFSILLISTVTVAVNVGKAGAFDSVHDCIRAAFFQVASVSSTTGFSTVDFTAWPDISKNLLILLMFIGASAGSTAGGLKISRIIIILKTVRLRIKKMLKPREVIPLKLDGDSIPVEVGNSAINYISIYLVFFILSMILIAFNGKDLTTTFTSVLTCISNAGPALGEVGSAGNFSGFSAFSKIIFSLIMLFGRLEIIPMIILISPSTWRGFTKTDAAFSKKL